MKNKIQKSLINVFIIINLMMMVRAQIDSDAPLISFLYKPVTFVQNYLSMWRGWNMFAPNPLRSNAYIDAVVIFEDDSKVTWSFPRPSESDPVPRYLYGERYRKYAVDGLRLDRNSHLWPDAARFVLKKIRNKNFKKIPKKVLLRRNWKTIMDWNEKFIPHREESKKSYKQYTFYTYDVR